MRICPGALIRILVALFLMRVWASGQIVENPAKPPAANAGRVVTLKEELRIEDTGEGYFFKNPSSIRVSPRGDIFFRDGQEQALLFDPQGRFVRDLFKKGQGPGELTSVSDTWVSPDQLFLRGNPPKILICDFKGNLIEELPLRGGTPAGSFIWADHAGLLLYGPGRPDPADGVGLRDTPWDIFAISAAGTSQERIGSFSISSFLEVEAGGAISVTSWNRLQVAALDGRSLFLNSSPEYLIEKFVRDKRSVALRFRRPFARQKRTASGGVSSLRGSGPDAPEFWPDIYALHIVDGRLWVQTWTVTEEKGILFDVFDTNGRYLDCFYIQSMMKDEGGRPARIHMTFAGGCAYFKEETSDGLIVIRKCRLVGL
ncbi:MAG: hypothetical protein GX465_01075 [Acidobacteria bacterium]|nr:hypothetical protein [Acidobacteriota bacterium]